MSGNGWFDKKSTKRTILGVLMILVLIVACLYDFAIQTTREVENQSKIQLKEVTQQEVQTIEVKMTACVQKVEYTAAILKGVNRFGKSELEELLKKTAQNSDLDRAAIVMTDGRVYSSSHLPSVASQYECVEAAFRGESGISDIFTSRITGEAVLSIYAPIYENEMIVGGIFGTIVIEHLIDLVSFSGFDGEAYSYVIQKDGNMIMQTKHKNKLLTNDNFYEFLDLTTVKTSVSTEMLRGKIKNKKAGYFAYSVRKEERNAYYYPINFHDWYVISVVPKEVLDTHEKALNRHAAELTAKILVLSAIVLFLVIFWNKRVQKRIKRAHYEVVSSNKKYEIAIQHTQNQMFEYNVTNDKLCNISKKLRVRMDVPEMVINASKKVAQGTLLDEDNQQVLWELIQSIKDGAEQGSTEIALKDGSFRKIHVSAIHQFDELHIIGTIEDITHIREVEQQYMREEQYCNAMLGKILSGFSMDITTGQLLSSFAAVENRESQESVFTYSTQIIVDICREIHPEYRSKIEQLYQLKSLLEIHSRGVKEIKEYFIMKDPGTNDYIWSTASIHFLNNPENGHPIIFSYIRNVDAEKKRELDLEYRSERDGLTGIYNRITIAKKANQMLAGMKNGEINALIMMDLDGFKNINDEYGHEIGDQLLQKVAEQLEYWVGKQHLAARMGGDEFVIFIQKAETKEEVIQLAEHVCQGIGEIPLMKEENGKITISIGIAFQQWGDSFEELYAKSDQALYQAKRGGKNRVAVWEN